jgi:hypothetical protein
VPCIAFGTSEEGEEVELVLKWRSKCEVRGLVCEAMAAMLANDLDLPIPEPFTVQVDKQFASAIPDQATRGFAEQSVGLNFGTRRLAPQLATWPVNRTIPLATRPLAAEIFAFDALIQNPDRRAAKPNCLHQGNEVFIVDHELAFSFLVPIIGWKAPWQAGGIDFLTRGDSRHIFYEGLQGTPIDLTRLEGAFEAIRPERIEEYGAGLPDEWRSETDAGERICEYLKQLKGNLNEAFDQVRVALA